MGKKKVAQPKAEAAAPGKGEAPRAEKPEGAKKGKRLSRARVYIKASYNNTVVSVTDMEGNVVTWASAGSLGFSGPKKATPFASSKIIATIAERLKNSGLKDVDVLVRGIGSGRDSAIRSLVGHGFNVLSIKEVTGIPHNGPRPKKVRRV